MRKGRMYGQFENFKINENLFGKPLNRDWVARVVFPIHSADSAKERGARKNKNEGGGGGERRERERLLYRTALPSPPATFPRFLYFAPVLTI